MLRFLRRFPLWARSSVCSLLLRCLSERSSPPHLTLIIRSHLTTGACRLSEVHVSSQIPLYSDTYLGIYPNFQTDFRLAQAHLSTKLRRFENRDREDAKVVRQRASRAALAASRVLEAVA